MNSSVTGIEKTNLQLSESCFKSIFELFPSALFVTGQDGKILWSNKNARKLFGAGAKESEVSDIWRLLPFLSDHKASFEKALESMQSQSIPRISFKNTGTQFFFEVLIFPLNFEKPDHFMVVKINDVTEQEKKEQYINRSQKMELVGSLAAGLAHDFNNVINGIKATLSSIRFSLESKNSSIAELNDDMEIIEKSAQRGSEIVEQLFSISKKEEMPLSSSDLNDIAKDVIKVCQTAFPKNIDLRLRLNEKKAIVEAYPVRIEQALLNLLINASHALTIMKKEGEKQGGIIELCVEKMYVGPRMCAYIPDAIEGYYWLISVADTGVGMDHETLLKMFDPFFTTKEKNLGTGLGLSMVYNVVRQHKGFIDVYSDPGCGAVFFIFLPVYEK